MNKQEAKQKLHNIAFAKMNARPDDLKLADVMQVIDQIDEPEKPAVPQFVADYIEYAKTTFCSLKGTISFDEIYAYNYATWSKDRVKLIAWVSIEENQEVFAKAWLFGYEVKQENLYYVSIPNAYHGDFGYSKEYGNYSFYDKNAATNVRFQLTESEIKENHAWAWKWAKPVEE